MSDSAGASGVEPEPTRIRDEIDALRRVMSGATDASASTAIKGSVDERDCSERMKTLLRHLGVERGAVLWKAALRDVRRDCAQARQTHAKGTATE